MDRDRAHVGDVFESLGALQNEVGNLALRILGIDLHAADPLRHVTRRVFLEKALALDTVWIARQHHRAIFQVGQHPRRDSLVVFNQVTLGIALRWPENLVRVRDLHGMRFVNGGLHLPTFFPLPWQLEGWGGGIVALAGYS